MKKRLLSLGLAVAMAASLTACGSSGGSAETKAPAGETKAADAAGTETKPQKKQQNQPEAYLRLAESDR